MFGRGHSQSRAGLEDAEDPLVEPHVLIAVVLHGVKVAHIRALVDQLPLTRGSQRHILGLVVGVAVVPEHDDADAAGLGHPDELLEAVRVVHVDENSVAHQTVVLVGVKRPRIRGHVVRLDLLVYALLDELLEHLRGQVHAVEDPRLVTPLRHHLTEEAGAGSDVENLLALGRAKLEQRVDAHLRGGETDFVEGVMLVGIRPLVVLGLDQSLRGLEPRVGELRGFLRHRRVKLGRRHRGVRGVPRVSFG